MNPIQIAIIALIALSTACTQTPEEAAPTTPAENANSDLAAALSEFENDEHDDLFAVVVFQHGDMIAEKYYNGDADTLVDIRSSGKSVASLLMGIAIDQGHIESLEDPVGKYWSDAADLPVGQVKLVDILTMRSGLAADVNDPDSPGYEDHMDQSDNPYGVALAVPNMEEPGTQWRYNSHAAYVAGVVIAKAAGMSLEEFARINLFEPLGITSWDWMEDRSGYTKGQGNLFMKGVDVARIGEMVRQGGVHQDRQIISKAWIDASLEPRVDISDQGWASHYGYYWYRHTFPVKDRDVEVFYASGNGGNKIYIVPDYDIAMSVTSRAYGQGRGHRRSDAILTAVLSALKVN